MDMTRVVKVSGDNLGRVVEEAGEVIRGGGLVVFPTETVYGLGADAYNVEAVRKIFLVKGRPPDNPLIVHIDSLEMFERVVRDPPDHLYKYVGRLWPGPFTIVYYRGDIPDVVSAGLETVAVRMPAHPVAQALIKYSQVPIAAPSANISGRPSPTSPEHVIQDLFGRVDMILDAGETLYGVESTVIDFTTDPPRLLRPGPLTVEELSDALGVEIEVPEYVRNRIEVGDPRSPGMKYRHYAPDASMVLVEYRGDLYQMVERVISVYREVSIHGRVGILATDETIEYYMGLDAELASLGSRSDLYTVAKNLYKMLRWMDGKGVDYLIVEGFEDRGLGLTIMNRLRRAAERYV